MEERSKQLPRPPPISLLLLLPTSPSLPPSSFAFAHVVHNYWFPFGHSNTIPPPSPSSSPDHSRGLAFVPRAPCHFQGFYATIQNLNQTAKTAKFLYYRFVSPHNPTTVYL